jgi:hypothetical protein
MIDWQEVGAIGSLLSGGAIVFLAFQTWVNYRSIDQMKESLKLQRKALEVDKYAELRQHHHDLMTFQIENPDTLEVFDPVKKPDKYKGKNDDEIMLDDREKKIFQLYFAEFDLYERVWELKEEKEKLSEFEWIIWLLYLEKMSHHWLFKYTFDQARTIFDVDCMNDIRKNIIVPEKARDKLEDLAKNEYNIEEKKELKFPEKVS